MPRAKTKATVAVATDKEVPRGPVRLKSRTALELNDETLDTLFGLASVACTQDEIARLMGVARRTLNYFLERHEEARDAYDQGMAQAKLSVRRKMLRLADTQSAAAIFLGKNLLGMKDVVDQNVNIKKEARDLSDDELMEIAQRQASEAKAGDSLREEKNDPTTTH
jgi:IS30 family transposase